MEKLQIYLRQLSSKVLENTLSRYEYMYTTFVVSAVTLIVSLISWSISHPLNAETSGLFLIMYILPLLWSYFFIYNFTVRLRNLFGVLLITVISPENIRFVFRMILAKHAEYTSLDLFLYPWNLLMIFALCCIVWPDLKADAKLIRYTGVINFIKFKLFYFRRLRLFRRSLADWEIELTQSQPDLANWLQQDWRTLTLYEKKDILNMVFQHECAYLSLTEPPIIQYDNNFEGKDRILAGITEYDNNLIRINWRIFEHKSLEELLTCFIGLIQAYDLYLAYQFTDDDEDDPKVYRHFAEHRDIPCYDAISAFYAKHYASQYIQWARKSNRNK